MHPIWQYIVVVNMFKLCCQNRQLHILTKNGFGPPYHGTSSYNVRPHSDVSWLTKAPVTIVICVP